MAGISMPVSVSDGLSSPFQSMTAQVSKLVMEYEKLHQTMSKPLSPSIPSIPKPTGAGIGDNGPISGPPDPYPKMIPTQQQFNAGLVEGQSLMGRMANQAKLLVGAYAGFQGAKAFIGMADTYMQTQSRIGMINDGLQTTEQLNNMIFNSANRVRGSYLDIAQNVTKLGIMAKDSFSSNAEIVKFTELMSKQFKVGGAGLQEQQAAMYQLSQAMASGRLSLHKKRTRQKLSSLC
ncbi:tape measure protein [Peptostreptococcus equinus]|uniref:Tape measure protein n=1 Tax=Peptostreptococcus equinus TaxID=3003601 RepID=A0ABY7JTH8_9FIRM|nr:tape measure protein [Peptostreptococcus sp. CBA3647]WAW15458.1 tape measure protein [Peptostreptococcus sp. CBA3647]